MGKMGAGSPKPPQMVSSRTLPGCSKAHQWLWSSGGERSTELLQGLRNLQKPPSSDLDLTLAKLGCRMYSSGGKKSLSICILQQKSIHKVFVMPQLIFVTDPTDTSVEKNCHVEKF